MILTDRFSDALGYAEKLHRSQTRKGNAIPYIAHLLAVAGTVLEHGGSEDAAIAGLLHDAVEDQGGMATLGVIEGRYGHRVASIVMACTDSVGDEPAGRAPWEQRKRHHIDRLKLADRDVALVTAADKLHNLNAMIRDVEREGVATLSRFNTPDRLVWYFLSIADALNGHAGSAPVEELRKRARTLQALVEPSPHVARPALGTG